MGKTPAVPFVFVGYGIAIPGSGDGGFFSLFRLVPEIPIRTAYFILGVFRELTSGVRVWCNNKMFQYSWKRKTLLLLIHALSQELEISGDGGDFMWFEIF